MRNARFWEFINGCEVKLTLRPGQVLEHVAGGRTDEGYAYTATTWEHEGAMLRREVTCDACDCDGRGTSGHDSIASIDPATFVPMYYSPELRRPDWRDAGGWQRDYFAEAAGY